MFSTARRSSIGRSSAAIFAFCLALSLPLAASDGPRFLRSFQRADANADGSVNITDPVTTFMWLFQSGAAPGCLDAADSNDDGDVDISDGVYTLNFLFDRGAAIPYPGHRRCDRDPTPDALDCQSYMPCACGGFAGFRCKDAEQFCDLPPNTCQAADMMGTCIPRHEACPEIYVPVCGCDGITYSNDCERVRAGAQKKHDGACGEPLEFRTLRRETASGAPAQVTIFRDASAWKAFWEEHGSVFFPPPPMPAVDFESEMVVAVVEHFTSGGYHVEIDAIVPSGDEIVVEFTRVEPSDDCPTTDALTQPYHFVATRAVPGDAAPVIRVRRVCCDMPLQASGVGACEMFLGYAWNGSECIGLSGCSCEGADCDGLFASPAECRAAYHGCPEPVRDEK